MLLSGEAQGQDPALPKPALSGGRRMAAFRKGRPLFREPFSDADQPLLARSTRPLSANFCHSTYFEGIPEADFTVNEEGTEEAPGLNAIISAGRLI